MVLEIQRFTRLTRIVPVLLAGLVLGSCNRTLDPDEYFIASSDMLLKVRSDVVIHYDPLTWQLGYNAADKEFRVHDDAMKQYYFVTCSSLPSSVGQKLNATVTWTQAGEVKSENGTFEVVRAENDRYWLWCGHKKRQIGVAVRLLR
ncbi:MAG: hypothetical protein ACOX5T_02775 [Candidatus Cryptobacteroides sp.]|jgi:hypothetical protein